MVRWGILATGRIAGKVAEAMLESDTALLVAVGSRSQKKADAFASRYAGVTAYGSYEDLLEDARLDAVYVSTPHPQHAEWTVRALEAGKAVLCEKPMGVNYPEVMAMVETAAFHERFLMEAFMYRVHPQTAKLVELVRDGAVGEVRHVNASHGFAAPFRPKGRLHNNELAGGAIMDVGCYPLSMARLLAGEEPAEIEGFAKLAENGVDLWASALLRFPSGVVARIATAVSVALDNCVEVIGTRGSIRVDQPWFGARAAAGAWSFQLKRGKRRQTIKGDAAPTYVLEVDAVADALSDRALESPAMSWEDSLANVKWLDKWRQQTSVAFDFEKMERQTKPVHGRTLKVRREVMRYGEVEGLDKPVSRLVLGCDNQPSAKHAAVMFDNYFEYGGNTFDTAHVYGQGRMETYLGGWIENRGVAKDVVVIGKGAHPPANFPDRVGKQLGISLERLRRDAIDLYFPHRDNPDVPVGEWMDALNAEKEAGRIKAFGASNWSLKRVRAANAYAAKHGLTPFSAVSNNFSLARMVDPVWPGCVAAAGEDWRKWLLAQRMPLFAWSSQARGYFTERFDKVKANANSGVDVAFGSHPSDEELRRCWFSRDNLRRRNRAIGLAEQRGVALIHMALAYVLNQPFPCFALIGPRALGETRSSLAALDIELDERELRWLNLATNRRPPPPPEPEPPPESEPIGPAEQSKT